jgi:hypothetical protein
MAPIVLEACCPVPFCALLGSTRGFADRFLFAPAAQFMPVGERLVLAILVISAEEMMGRREK